MPDEADNSKFQEMLRQYHEAVNKEFNVPAGDGGEAIAENIGKDFDKLLPKAIETIAYLLENAESESVQANLAKYVIESRVGKLLADKKENPIEALIKELRNADTKS